MSDPHPLHGLLDYIPAALDRIPFHLRGGMERYVEDGVVPGDGLLGIIRNAPVCEVAPRLDEESLAGLMDIIRFLHMDCPGKCWGSVQAVENWSATGGLRGYAQRRGLVS